MAQKNIEKGSDEWQFFQDFFALRKKYHDSDGDPDKVVERLEALKEECENPLQDYDPNYFIEKAIEIVKGGGVDGN